MKLSHYLLLYCLGFILAWQSAPAQIHAAQEQLPLHLFTYDKTLPLAYHDSLMDTQQGVRIYQIAYASPLKGQVTGLLFVPPGPGPFPGILLQHGAPGSALAQTPRGLYLARHGAVVLATNAPFAQRGGDPLQFTLADSVDQVRYIINLQRAVDLLLRRPDIDTSRLGYVGRSYSGSMGVLLAGIERRIKTYVLAVADGGFVSHFSSTTALTGDQLSLEGPARKRWLAAQLPIEPIRFIHRTPGAGLLLQSARQDEAVAAADAEALHRAAPAGTLIKWYDAGHRLNAQAYLDQLAWFHQQLGTRAAGPGDEQGPAFPAPPSAQKRP
ncbi:alpha/beta hydrolase family protein [Fibrella forsythiae]|uniref:Uncharacterized protein n=1 Tax=Fibrella forsythiae TaxID=2817061 RepID=A0ABS3JSS2_9BACT|nr:hypothetical protein [Fibrella forsythiae]MBO0953051.1 hypothetical protein [Fibrella forsythiae]